MARPPLTEAQEDYLKHLFLLEEALGGPVPTQALAERLSVKPPSVTEMLKKLKALGLLEHEPYRGARLTERGRKVALEVLRHHRLLEAYLHQALGYGWEEVHQEAERLEHVISEDLEERIAEYLGHPPFDPHGDPIPTKDLTLPSSKALPLTEAPLGRARVARALAQDRGTLNLLARLGLVPGKPLRILERGEGVRVEVEGEVYLLPRALAQAVGVEPLG
ncbi:MULTISPECIES: manganese-dependent transcriptional regulator MntR [Thermus]|jgi:DtxR family Mn-dependent transcriptional regulator|uniref:Manganese transport regulator n=2 Tax=Thermus thermophilus TaxID=274 RepID=Q5SK94_THET8|nr:MULTISPECIES: metal-dependent transcriptional regulator [Thermus]QZY59246.1 metal-dependent transcriptional regulator [Thermus thermophilus]BAD70577.1 transcriptional repressor [Thermus thermophilus HB8]BCP65855.1 DtxR family transcriptional regulator [Thermus thermophilus]BDA37390.1 DtxR family transcriptional regulator [Thermus thermophilus]BDE45114.1 DtxR family transcriptional regulator [Thermus thermophilus]